MLLHRLNWSGANWMQRRRYNGPYSSTSYEINLKIRVADMHCTREDWASCRFSENHSCYSHSDDVFLQCRGNVINTAWKYVGFTGYFNFQKNVHILKRYLTSSQLSLL